MQNPIIAILGVSGLFFALTACEGEPPKVPENPAPAVISPTATPASVEAPPPTNTAPAAPSAAASPVGSTAVPAPAPATPAAAPAEAVVAATPVATLHANIVGTVTTTPARAAGSAVVYLEDAPALPGRTMSASIDNHQMTFIPFVQVVAVGGRIVFTNSDPFPHNVFSPDNGRFDLGSVAQHGTAVHVFKTAGAYTLLCNLHPNMVGYVVVSPSSYFAKANAKGEFTIKDVPAGTYKITAWAPRQKPVTEAVTVKDSDATVNFALQR
jgi:plastocyanin